MIPECPSEPRALPRYHVTLPITVMVRAGSEHEAVQIARAAITIDETIAEVRCDLAELTRVSMDLRDRPTRTTMHDPTDPPDDANGEIVRACPHGYPFGTPCEDCDAMADWSWWNGKH